MYVFCMHTYTYTSMKAHTHTYIDLHTLTNCTFCVDNNRNKRKQTLWSTAQTGLCAST